MDIYNFIIWYLFIGAFMFLLSYFGVIYLKNNAPELSDKEEAQNILETMEDNFALLFILYSIFWLPGLLIGKRDN